MAKRIKITQTGWDGFTGDIGMVAFEDGVSTDVVGPRQFNVIAAVVAVVEIDDEGETLGSPGIQDNMKGAAVIGAPVLNEMLRATDEEKKAEAKADAAPKPDVDPLAVVYHSKADLEAIAEKKGIAGLRAIAEPLGEKGRSINELIKEILKAEAKLKAHADALAASTETTRAPVAADVEVENPDEVVEESGEGGEGEQSQSEQSQSEQKSGEQKSGEQGQGEQPGTSLQSEPNTEIKG